MNESHFDCIVVGFGGVGSAALRYAAQKGWRVLGIDRYGPANNQGSSHGQTRVIRKSYFEHPDYVPLLLDSYERWDELNKRHRTSPEIKELKTDSGVLQIGPENGVVVSGVLDSAAKNGLTIERFTADEIHRRLPILNVPQNHVGVYEPDGGFLRVELCVAAFIKQAIVAGAELRSNVSVTSWHVDDRGVVHVQTDEGNFSADRMIVTAGPWAAQLLGDLNLPLKLLAKQQHWYQLDRVEQKLLNQFPCVLMEQDNEEVFYATPELDTLGMKVCQHSGGRPLDSADALSRDLDVVQQQHVEDFLKRYFHFSKMRMVHHSMCMYTMAPEQKFIVDVHPQHSNVAYAAGLSGHGFKFAPSIGHRLVEMLEGTADERFDFLKASLA